MIDIEQIPLKSGGMRVEDRAISVLGNYDLNVLRTWKGRGAILFETNTGTKIIREYTGPKEKVIFLDRLLNHIKEQGFPNVDALIKNKDGELLTVDTTKKVYLVKDYLEGRDCNIWDSTDCMQAVENLSRLHKKMLLNDDGSCVFLPISTIAKEYERHNIELKRIRKFIRNKGQKTDFEIYLLKNYSYFQEQAEMCLQQVSEVDFRNLYEEVQKTGSICHGDYQYHNIKMLSDGIGVSNFEKCCLDSQMRDLYLFMRKVLEKNNWNIELGNQILLAYQKNRFMKEQELLFLYYRLSYPDKFWKIVNFYYNNGKSWLPMRHMEKMQKLMIQESMKDKFLEAMKEKL